MAASTNPPIRELDVRPILQAGGEPFQAIMDAVEALKPGESLKLFAPFRPVPLFSVMANRGFGASDRPLDGGDWEVIFTPVEVEQQETSLAFGSSPSAAHWPDPVEELNLCDLEPPEPMVRILETMEELRSGETLFALLAREPLFLFPELAKRGHEWAGNFDASGTAYRLLIRHGGKASS